MTDVKWLAQGLAHYGCSGPAVEAPLSSPQSGNGLVTEEHGEHALRNQVQEAL